MADRQRHIIGLDLVRFGAACLVMVLHLGFWSWAPTGSNGTIQRLFGPLPQIPALQPYAWTGWVGVEVFFVLSGFVIAFSADSSSPLRFARSRVVRLWPGAWVCAALTAAIALAYGHITSLEAALRLANTLVLSPLPYWIDGVYWSLIVELAFYAVVFGLLVTDRFHQVGYAIGMIGLCSGAYNLAGFLGLVDRPGLLLRLLLVEHGCLFALGVYLWLVLFKGFNRGRTAMTGALVLGCAFEVLWSSQQKLSLYGIDEMAWTPLVVWVLAVAAVAASVACNSYLNRALARFAGTVRLLGLATYPLYLLHSIVGGAVLLLMSRLGADGLVALGVAMALSIALSLVLARYVEPKVQRWLRTTLERISMHRLSRATRPVMATN